jgi:CubicO group peptidase (beta-lactamase class C family)
MGLAFISTLGLIAPTLANWQQAQRQTIVHGVQAVLMCNGLFTSHRSLTQVFDQELKYLEPRRFDGARAAAATGPYQVDWASRSVTVGTDAPGTAVTRFFVKVLAESIASTLIGMLVEDGLLSFDDPSPVDWLPELTVPEADPRIERTIKKRLWDSRQSGTIRDCLTISPSRHCPSRPGLWP